jgi:HK97 family phage portal protein
VGGARSFVEELRPLHPSLCRVSRQRSDGTLEYEYRPQDGPVRTLGQERVLHFRGLSTDGLSGVPIYQLIRNAVGIALAAEKHLGTFLRKGTRLAGMLIPQAPLDKPQRQELRSSWNQDFGGADNSGSVGVLPFGLDFRPLVADHSKAQMLELRDFQVQEILRFLGVPGVVVGYADKTATYASAKEFFESGGIKHSVMPWVTNFEAEEEQALLPEGDSHYIKHNLDVLLRANTKDRFEALSVACGRPWLTGNEVREIEDWNPIADDPGMDQVAKPPNSAGGEEEEPPEPEPGLPPPPASPAPKDEDEDEPDARGRQFIVDAAARVVRREVAAIRGSGGGKGAALRFARDPAGWRAWVADYYERHAAHVAKTMHVNAEVARRYCEEQAAELRRDGIGAAERWPETAAPRLVAAAGGE